MSAKMDSSNTKCDCPEKKKNHSILYALLSSGTSSTTTTTTTTTSTTTETEEQQQQQQTANNQVAIFPWDCTLRSPHNTHFVPSIVKLKYPEEVCQYAAQLLLKTVDFIKNLPSILCLSWNDRTTLLQHCWSELLILTMAQYQFFIEVEKVSLSTESDLKNTTTTSSSSSSLPSSVNVSKSAMTSLEKSCPENDCREGALLKYIIAMQGIPTASDIDTLNAFFHKCQTLQLDDKEFAYLKSTIFFNPDVTGLSSSGLVETLQSHAQLQLSEYVTALHPHDPLRFAHLLLSLPPLRNVRARVITHLFFRELIGDVEMEEILRQMLMHAQ